MNIVERVNITTNVDAQGLVNACGTNKICIINSGVTVSLNGNVNVAAIINRVCISSRIGTPNYPFFTFFFVLQR